MLENKGAITPLWHIPKTSVTPETGLCDSCSFPTRTKEEDKYKVIKETLLQLNVTTAERTTGGNPQLGLSLFSVVNENGREKIRSSWFPQSRSCLYFSLTYATHTRTQYLQHLRVFGDGLEEA